MQLPAFWLAIFANNANIFSNDWEIIQSIYILFFDC